MKQGSGRRTFLKQLATAGSLGFVTAGNESNATGAGLTGNRPSGGKGTAEGISFPRAFRGDQLAMVAFPLGGIGTGSISLGGRGQLRDWEIFNRPEKGRFPTYTFALSGQRRRVRSLSHGFWNPGSFPRSKGARAPVGGTLPVFHGWMAPSLPVNSPSLGSIFKTRPCRSMFVWKRSTRLFLSIPSAPVSRSQCSGTGSVILAPKECPLRSHSTWTTRWGSWEGSTNSERGMVSKACS